MLPTLEPACQRGLLLALKKSIFGQLCLYLISKIFLSDIWWRLGSVRPVYCNVGRGRGCLAVKRQWFAGFVNNSQRVDLRVSCFIDNIMILKWGRSLLNSASSQYMLQASCKLTALPPLLPLMLSLSQNPAPKISPAKIPVLQKFSFHLHALKATLCSPLQFSQRWGQYGQGHDRTLLLLDWEEILHKTISIN